MLCYKINKKINIENIFHATIARDMSGQDKTVFQLETDAIMAFTQTYTATHSHPTDYYYRHLALFLTWFSSMT